MGVSRVEETMTEVRSISLTIQLGKVHLLSYKPQALGMRQQDARVDGLGPSTDGAAQREPVGEASTCAGLPEDRVPHSCHPYQLIGTAWEGSTS